jgi:glycerol-3-phosphate O-acyltransferase 3/4
MLFVRNWSLIRQLYIWGLDLTSRVIYGERAAGWRWQQHQQELESDPSRCVSEFASDRGPAAAAAESGTASNCQNAGQSDTSSVSLHRESGPQGDLQRRLSRLHSELELGGLGEWESYDAIRGLFDVIGDEACLTDRTEEYTNTRIRTHAAGARQQRAVLPLIAVVPPLAEAVGAMAGDSLTKCFESSAPRVWNLMTRTRSTPVPIILWPIWLFSIFIRYGILFPLRLGILIVGVSIFSTGFTLVHLLLRRRTRFKVYLQKQLIRFLASTLVASWSGLVRYHGERPRRRPNQIYVANHTSLIDLAIMIKDYPFSTIGQRHGGLAGRIQDLMSLVQNHIWFDREEGHDRRIVQRLLQEHVQNGEHEPVLVFPEGTCVNNEYCIMFKKGSFELGALVYPVAIKYNKAYADVFWNSARQVFLTHLLALMTSWAVVCDVYYLEPQQRRPEETPAAFAARVKHLIARRIGLIETNWDGFLKRHQVSPKFREHRQEMLAFLVRKQLERISTRKLPSIAEEVLCKADIEVTQRHPLDSVPSWIDRSTHIPGVPACQALRGLQRRRSVQKLWLSLPASASGHGEKHAQRSTMWSAVLERCQGLVVRLVALGLLVLLVGCISFVLSWLNKRVDYIAYVLRFWLHLWSLVVETLDIARHSVQWEITEARKVLRSVGQACRLIWR